VIEDACRGIDLDGSVAATREVFRAGDCVPRCGPIGAA
jgi:hypothetical protein